MTGGRLYSPADLAELFGVSERVVMDWRREHAWPSVRVGRTIRFTQAQLDQILERHSAAPKPTTVEPDAGLIPGQSKGSAARRRAS